MILVGKPIIVCVWALIFFLSWNDGGEGTKFVNPMLEALDTNGHKIRASCLLLKQSHSFLHPPSLNKTNKYKSMLLKTLKGNKPD